MFNALQLKQTKRCKLIDQKLTIFLLGIDVLDHEGGLRPLIITSCIPGPLGTLSTDQVMNSSFRPLLFFRLFKFADLSSLSSQPP